MEKERLASPTLDSSTTVNDNTTHELTPITSVYGLKNCKEFMGRKLFGGIDRLSSANNEEAPPVKTSALPTPATTVELSEEKIQEMNMLEVPTLSPVTETSTTQLRENCKEFKSERKLSGENDCLSLPSSEEASVKISALLTPATNEEVSEEKMMNMSQMPALSPVIETSTTQFPSKEDAGDAEVVSLMSTLKETIADGNNNEINFYEIKVDEEMMMTPIKEEAKVACEKVSGKQERSPDINKKEESSRVEEEPTTTTTKSAPSVEPLNISFESCIKSVVTPVRLPPSNDKSASATDIYKTPTTKNVKMTLCWKENEENTNEQIETSQLPSSQLSSSSVGQPSTSNNQMTLCWKENEENTNEQIETFQLPSSQPSSSSVGQLSTSTNQFSLPSLNVKVTEDVAEVNDFEAKTQSSTSTPLSPIPETSNQHSEPTHNKVGGSGKQQTTVDELKGSTEPAEHSPRRSTRAKKINKKLQTPKMRQTPMGLPKPNRLKKEEFSVEEIYRNKNYHTPKPKAWETIFEEPKKDKKGQVKFVDKRLRKRAILFYTVPSDRPAKKRDRECSKELRKKANERKKRRMEYGISEEFVKSRLNVISDDEEELKEEKEEKPPLLSLS